MSNGLSPELLDCICRLTATLPRGVTDALAVAIRNTRTVQDREVVVNRLLPELLVDNRTLFREFSDAWVKADEAISGAEIASALSVAALQGNRVRTLSGVELVWTGPTTISAGLRSTEQVILEMISAARESIFLVAFAAYRIETLVTELRSAVARGVRLVFVLEDKDESGGKVSVNALSALSGANLSQATVYIWPLEQRPRNERGQYGALHAKFVLVDGHRLFVSSANLTEFALNLNIELGVLLTGGDAPRQMERNLTELIRTGVLRKTEVRYAD
jgi:phosphatidylserine/phosphatidylglycerophosphate/cardiolipin synthase-like enzyme